MRGTSFDRWRRSKVECIATTPRKSTAYSIEGGSSPFLDEDWNLSVGHVYVTDRVGIVSVLIAVGFIGHIVSRSGREIEKNDEEGQN